jgi:hypothetical protein
MRQVDSNHAMTVSAQPVDYNSTDEPGRTRHHNPHLEQHPMRRHRIDLSLSLNLMQIEPASPPSKAASY